MAEINSERLLDDLRTLAQFGQYQTGVDRVAFSEPDIAARRWLVVRMSEAGLDAGMDRFANVLGRAPSANRTVLVGSHTVSVPRGGWLDGTLGVAFGLEISRTLAAAGFAAVDVVSFQDEEGTFVPCLGSKAFCGVLEGDIIAKAKSAENVSLTDGMAAHRLDEQTFALEPDRQLAFFEAHIEQGPRLEESACPVGIATAIVGICRFRVIAQGRADHAGTTPMAMRRDAGAALIDSAHALLSAFRAEAATETVWNIGAMTFRPGAPNVVPNEAAMVVEFRDTSEAVLDGLEAALRAIVEGNGKIVDLSLEIEPMGQIAPMDLDSNLADLMAEASMARAIEPMRMPSGAGHDAMVLGTKIPSALMFVPSIGGRSHHISEDTRPADIVTGCQVMADAVLMCLQREGRGA